MLGRKAKKGRGRPKRIAISQTTTRSQGILKSIQEGSPGIQKKICACARETDRCPPPFSFLGLDSCPSPLTRFSGCRCRLAKRLGKGGLLQGIGSWVIRQACAQPAVPVVQHLPCQIHWVPLFLWVRHQPFLIFPVLQLFFLHEIHHQLGFVSILHLMLLPFKRTMVLIFF